MGPGRAYPGQSWAADAGTAAGAPALPWPARPRAAHPDGTIGPVHVIQIMWWQVLAGLVVAADARGGSTLAAAAGILAVVLLVPTVVRVRGRWLYQWTGVWLRYALRSRHMTVPHGDIRAGLLAFAEPSAAVEAVEIDSEPAGILAHAGGITAVLELGPTDGGVLVGAAQPLPSPVALLPADDPQSPPTSLQLVVRVQPAPSPLSGGLVAQSYQELAGGTVPAARRAWLALQVLRTPGVYEDAELRASLALGVRRLRRRLRQEQVPHRVLDGEELLTVTAQLSGVDTGTVGTYETQHGRPLASEGWRAVAAGTAVQSCYRFTRWPDTSWQVDPLLCGVPAAATSLALAVTRDPDAVTGSDGVVMEVAVRVSTVDSRQLAAVDAALTRAVRAQGGDARRLDGEQRRGLAATLPLGGFLR